MQIDPIQNRMTDRTAPGCGVADKVIAGSPAASRGLDDVHPTYFPTLRSDGDA
jgi:hypothetical protein